MKRAALYCRVSTSEQDPAMQVAALREYVGRRGWELREEHVFIDHGYSGRRDSRPALDQLMRAARRREFEVVAVWKFDRFARSSKGLILSLDEFRDLGVDFVSLTEVIDTSTPMGRVAFTVVAAMAEFEASLTRERVRTGVAKARATGKRLGRPWAAIDPDRVRALREQGLSVREIAKRVGGSKSVVARMVAGVAASQ